MRQLLITTAVALIGIAAFLPAGEYEMQATTYSGELYILGSGDTCDDAFTNHAPIPADFRSLECVYTPYL